MDWFLYDNGFRRERVKPAILNFWIKFPQKGYLRCRTEKSHFCVRPWSSPSILNSCARGLKNATVF